MAKSKVISLENKEQIEIPTILKFGEKEFKFTPFEELTTRQYGIIRAIFAESFKALNSTNTNGNIDGIIDIMKASTESILGIIAAIYIEKEEHYFKKETYNERLDLFLDTPQSNFDFKEVLLTSFFDGKEKSIMADSQIFLQTITKANAV